MRIFLPLIAIALTPGLAIADDNPPASTDAIYACTSLTDDSERLACYDMAVGRFKEAEESGELTTVSRAEVEEVQKEAFGFSLPSLPKLAMPKFGNGDDTDDGAIDSITVGVVSIQERRVGGLIVTLENGQVWEQADTRKVSFSRRKGVKEATIKTASFGSYMMKLDGGVAFRAKRIK